jgi:Protein kinase domain
MTIECPEVADWATWLRRGRPADAPRTAHLRTCTRCQGVLAGLSGDFTLGLDHPPPPGGEAPDLSPGSVLLGKYEVVRVLGAGGMGTVVCARHLGLNTLVALKLIRPELAGDRDLVSRFSREARAAVRLESAHVRRVFDLEQLPSGAPMMVMEYLEGEGLDARVERGPLEVGEAVEWIRQTLEGLAAAHAAGIVHRDLKPGNLFIQSTDSGEVLKILDFGIAKSDHPEIEAGLAQTSHQLVVGSPAYMSPEQLTPGQGVDLRTDLWSLGCTLYTLLLGHPPFEGKDLLEVAWNVRNGALPVLPRSLPPGVRELLGRCLQRQPAARYQSTAELAAALALVEAEALVPRARTGWRWAVAAGALAAVALGGALMPGGPSASPVAEEPLVRALAPEEPPLAAPPATAPEPPAEAPATPQAAEVPAGQRPAPAAAPGRRPRAASHQAPAPDAGDDVFGERI